MKAVLFGVKLTSQGEGYVAEQLGETMTFPSEEKQLPSFFEKMVPHLFRLKVISLYGPFTTHFQKAMAEENAKLLQNGVNCDRSSFGVQSPVPEQRFLKKTWLGTKPSKPKCVPPLPEDYFLLY